MVDVKNIIKRYEDAEKIKNDALAQEKAAELEKYVRNAVDIENFLIKTVCPIFENIKEDVISGGYSCEVDKILREIKFFQNREKEYILEIKIKISKGAAGFFDQYLLYRGKYEDASIISEIKASAVSMPEVSEPRPIVACTNESIDKDITKLLESVFAVS